MAFDADNWRLLEFTWSRVLSHDGNGWVLNRWVGIICATLMVSANATLFLRDILPGWRGGDPPALDDLSQGTGVERHVQIGIYNAEGTNIGRSWTVTELQIEYLNVTSTTMLYPITLPNGIATPPVRVETTLRYRETDGVLAELVMTIRGLPATLELRGDLVPPDDFVCKWRLGPRQQGQFVLDAQATRAIGDVLRPFDRLPGLYVGRTWRMQLLDPLSRVVPGLQAEALVGDTELVRVTRTEIIQHRGEPVETFVVEAPRMRGWVSRDGQVLRQEVDLPILGTLAMNDEPYNAKDYEAARQWSPGKDPDEPDDPQPAASQP
jgi:hypothetical protein